MTTISFNPVAIYYNLVSNICRNQRFNTFILLSLSHLQSHSHYFKLLLYALS